MQTRPEYCLKANYAKIEAKKGPVRLNIDVSREGAKYFPGGE
jgi:hypothetical protein